MNFIRDHFPDREPFRAWSVFTFLADDGSANEIDLLVVAVTGVYLVEIKSFSGRIEGDAASWTWLPPDGRPERHLDNPLLLADRKAKRLKSLLSRQPVFRGTPPSFFIEPIVFLAEPSLRVALSDEGRAKVYGPDDHGRDQVNDLPGIIRLFARVEPGRRARVDRPLSEALARAVDMAGIRESVALRTVGQYQLGELLDEGDAWQDYAVNHPQSKGDKRRVRIYCTDRAVSPEERQAQQRAAEREFRVLRELIHPGVDRPLELVHSERGPALIFDLHPDALRLDHWLRKNDEGLDISDRVKLVEDLAEIVREAHRKGIYHRALSPRTVRVLDRGGRPTLRICDWQTALRAPSSSLPLTSATMLGTVHVPAHVSKPEQLYLAPELAALPNAEALPADIWSLGALAILILSGKPPAPDLDGVRRLLLEHGHLSLAAVMDAPPRELERLVNTATDSEAHRRYLSVQDFLEQLNHALEDMTRPDLADPLDARAGDKLEGGWVVERRVGSGSTSVVLVATHPDGHQEALKVARSEEQAQRLQAEFETLSKLRDRCVIETFGLATIGGRTVLRLEVAHGTLGDTLRRDGRLSLDLLERFGSNLLHAVSFLDQEGIRHRDIKPDNLGIAKRGQQRELRLILLDFSLAGTDPADLRVGTRGYLDPFLESRPTRRWDEQAERFAAAVTLYEMATGARPVWGDGSTDPALLSDDLPRLEAALFDPAVRDGLLSFFQRALHRDPAKRFGTAADLQAAWNRSFAGQEAGTSRTDHGTAVADLDLSAVTKRTLLSELPLAPRVRDAVERLGVTTAAELADIPGGELVRISGLGAATRTEVGHLARLLRDHLAETRGTGGSVDLLASKLVPGKQADEAHRGMAAALLGLSDAPGLPDWPSYREAVTVSGLSEQEAAEGVEAARARWSKGTPELTPVRREIRHLLAARGGIAGAGELASLLLSARGSSAKEPERTRKARAVVRAALETEATLQSPTFVGRRLGAQFLVALNGTVPLDDGVAEWDADVLAEAAARLGEAAVALAARTPLPERDETIRTLREVELPPSLPPLPEPRLVRLAAAAAPGVAVSAQLSLYPVGMPAARAVQESRAVLLSRSGIMEQLVRERVRQRFPEAEALPGRPELDDLLAGVGLLWDDGVRGFLLPTRGGSLTTMTSYRRSTLSTTPPDETDLEVRALDERLALVRTQGGFLALSVDLARLDRAIRTVVAVSGGSPVDVDTLLVQRMRRLIESTPGGDWSKVLRADLVPGERGWARLLQVVRKTVDELEAELLATPGLVVLSGVGLLARYDQLSFLDRLRDAVTVRTGGHPLQGIIVVSPSPGGPTRPTIDGKSIPVLTANQWARLTGAWLRRHEPGDAA